MKRERCSNSAARWWTECSYLDTIMWHPNHNTNKNRNMPGCLLLWRKFKIWHIIRKAPKGMSPMPKYEAGLIYTWTVKRRPSQTELNPTESTVTANPRESPQDRPRNESKDNDPKESTLRRTKLDTGTDHSSCHFTYLRFYFLLQYEISNVWLSKNSFLSITNDRQW